MADDVQQDTSVAEAQESVQPEGQVSQGEPAEGVSDPQPETPKESPSALEPGGDRFKEVWARAKKAEDAKRDLEAKYQQEREERIRLEERQKIREEAATQTPEKVYEWEELEAFIAEGKLTLAQAQKYREKHLRDSLRAEQTKVLESHLRLDTRKATIEGTLDRYRAANPNLVIDGTPERNKLVAEYKYHVEVLGFPASRATELAAARAAFGDVAHLESQAKLKAKPVEREGFMETTTAAKPAPKAKDPISDLSPAQKDHYERMIKNGRYGSYRPQNGITADHWKAVRAELSWTRKK